MYSLTGRLNAVAFNTLIALTVLSALNFISAYLNRTDPTIVQQFKIKDFKTFARDKYINEDALSFTFDFEADLRQVFNWNTNIVFASLICEFNTSKSDSNIVTIWDQRIPREDTQHHVIKLKDEYPEYYLTDVNKLLKDTEIKVYFHWEQMPVVGPSYGGKVLVGTFKTPKNYISGSLRKYRPAPDHYPENY